MTSIKNTKQILDLAYQVKVLSTIIQALMISRNQFDANNGRTWHVWTPIHKLANFSDKYCKT